MHIFLASLALLFLALPATATEITFEFSGTVDLISDSAGDGPPVSVGDAVHGSFFYIVEDAVVGSSSPSYSTYSFPAGSMATYINFPDTGQSFQLFASDGNAASYLLMDSSDQFWRNIIHAEPFSGSPGFGYAYPGGSASIQFLLYDNVAPLTLLSSTDLVDESTDVQLGAAVHAESRGEVFAIEGGIQPSRDNWRVQWRFDRTIIHATADPVTVEGRSFGAVKSLF